MQGQYGSATDKKLSRVAGDLWKEWGFRNGIMRGFWVTVAREIPAYAGVSINLCPRAGLNRFAGFYMCYEYTKQRFQAKLTPNALSTQLPVWALLTSGAMGGVGYVSGAF